MQIIYCNICLGPKRGFGSKERLYAPSGYHLDTFLTQMSQFFYSKNGVGEQNDSS